LISDEVLIAHHLRGATARPYLWQFAERGIPTSPSLGIYCARRCITVDDTNEPMILDAVRMRTMTATKVRGETSDED